MCRTNCHPVLALPPPPRGLFPIAYDDASHTARCLAQLRSKDKPIEKYIYLSQLKHTNEVLFYRLCLANMLVCNDRYTYRRVVNIERVTGIYAYYLHPHCRGRMPTTFSHFLSPRRLGAPRDISMGSFIDHFASVYFHQG
jgi:hypothetical protein